MESKSARWDWARGSWSGPDGGIARGWDEIDDDVSTRVIRHTLEGRLRCLKTDYLDLYQLHIGNLETIKVVEVRKTLEELVAEVHILELGSMRF